MKVIIKKLIIAREFNCFPNIIFYFDDDVIEMNEQK